MSKSLGYKNKYSLKLFLICWAAYFSTYICRLNFSIVSPELVKNNVLSEAQIAVVSSAFFICYGIGQLFSGILGDKASPRLLVFLGTFISALSNILIFLFSKSYIALTFLWGINGIVQSLVWSPILRIAGDYFDKNDKQRFAADISTTVTLGTLSSYALGLVTMRFLEWNYVFLTCGISTLLISFLWIIQTGKLNLYNRSVQGHTAEKKLDLSLKQFIKMFFASGCAILIIPIAVHGTLKDSVTQWIPTFFADKFNFRTDISALLTMVLPIINVSGAYIARVIYKKLNDVMKTAVVFFSAAMLFFVVIRFIGTDSPIISLVCLAVVTTCMHAVNVLFITLVPLQFGKYGCVSTMGGMLNSSAYIGCGMLNIAAGNILNEDSSWNMLFLFWILLCIAAIIFTVICSFVWKKFVLKS